MGAGRLEGNGFSGRLSEGFEYLALRLHRSSFAILFDVESER